MKGNGFFKYYTYTAYIHCVKSVRIQSFLVRIFLYSLRMRENTDQKNSKQGHSLCNHFCNVLTSPDHRFFKNHLNIACILISSFRAQGNDCYVIFPYYFSFTLKIGNYEKCFQVFCHETINACNLHFLIICINNVDFLQKSISSVFPYN